ncbi:crotonase/enoyl-CoA hydratase family protein [Aureimonas flava]|uniref:Crotonase/enoyl-CoA hydratase family protein n=1 Tax=Aureimonas flava TaxID=2320271 RepID=A0A3A1WNA2_9HYPH|nr:crotonase/enoyl-CoA hydratase family protein [Aureimonas flava]RIY03377.1 crotonase/enoyl-CoA hydratase family protein [Aureimonas flava]
MSQHVATDVADGVFRIRLDRPDKKNALDRAMYGALAGALRAAEADDAVGCILFLGAPGAFSAGNDIADFAASAGAARPLDELVDFLDTLAGAAKPMIAAVDGLAIGIGTTLLLHCDLVYATPRSLFRTPFSDLGVVPEAASSLLGPLALGHQRAFALLVMGETWSAEAAREAGLVLAVGEDAEAEAETAARRLAAKPREAVRIGRELLRTAPDAVRERIAVEADLFADRLRSTEAQAAFAAFLKRG